MLVGLEGRVPTGELIRPRPEWQSLNGRPDLIAVRGIVRGVHTSNPKFAALRTLQDVARSHTPNKGFGGQASAYWDAEQGNLFMGASPEVKRIVTGIADMNNRVIGYLHAVSEDEFVSQEPYSGPDGFCSPTAVRVIGCRVLTYDALTDMFGPELQELPDPLSHPKIEHDIRAVYASGVLATVNMAADLVA
ncbi:MAG TPA: hypothetical protein VGS08_02915 [Candidatus Saccharimonadales bacterium]|nr:hypothetical protein [Candidatus Saccharimonadales bacterium]